MYMYIHKSIVQCNSTTSFAVNNLCISSALHLAAHFPNHQPIALFQKKKEQMSNKLSFW